MIAIARKWQQRATQRKPSKFRVREQEVDFFELVRYFERKGVSIDDVMSRPRDAPTPEAVICLTPIASPITTPAVLAVPESLLATIRNYVNGSFDSGTWVKTKDTRVSIAFK